MKQHAYSTALVDLHQRLRTKADAARTKFQSRHAHAASFFQSVKLDPGRIRDHAARIVSSTALAGTMMLTAPALSHGAGQAVQLAHMTLHQRQHTLATALQTMLPRNGWSLTPEQEQEISRTVRDIWGIPVAAQFQGNRLNHAYGLIGAEQHLPRFPGDTVGQHDAIQRAGITPGHGAWGLFTDAKASLTREQIEQEKYYVAVQTLYLPDWNTNHQYLKEWYRYRKVLVINPENGKTVVADIADAGPAQFTGKHFGGSPEIMAYLELNTGKQKGPVVLFFIEDSDEPVPLGPVEYNKETGQISQT